MLYYYYIILLILTYNFIEHSVFKKTNIYVNSNKKRKYNALHAIQVIVL